MKIVRFQCNPGDFGRLGDQMHFYYRARTYAESIGATFQMMPWLGEIAFNLYHPTDGEPDVILTGKESFLLEMPYDQRKARQWFIVPKGLRSLCGSDTVVHLRRGDLLEPTNKMPIIGLKQYEDFLATLRLKLEDCKILSDDNPYQNWNTFCPQQWAFMQDFHIMTMAKTLLCGNSGFSHWAGFLGYGKAYIPRLGEKIGRCAYSDFVPLMDYWAEYMGTKIV
jgi:hypothetical protein